MPNWGLFRRRFEDYCLAIDINAQTTTGEDVKDVEVAKAATITESVTGEVHRPDLIDVSASGRSGF